MRECKDLLNKNENVPLWQSAILCAQECFYPSRTDIDIYYIYTVAQPNLPIVFMIRFFRLIEATMGVQSLIWDNSLSNIEFLI